MLLTPGISFVNSSEELLNIMSVFVSIKCSEIRKSVTSKHIKLCQHPLTSKMQFHYPKEGLMMGRETVFAGFPKPTLS